MGMAGRMGTGRLLAAWLVCHKDLRGLLLSPGTYLVVLLAGLAAHLFLNTLAQSIADSGLAVLSGAFNLPIYSVLFVTGLFLALASVTSISREREQGTLEVLFYGPIDAVAYIGGKLVSFGLAYLGLLALYLVCYALFAGTTGFAFAVPTWAVIGLSVPVVMHVVALGIFVSTVTRRVRTSLAWFLLILLVLLALQFSPDLLEMAPAGNRFYPPLRLARIMLERINQAFTWVSPFALLIKGTEAVRRADVLQYVYASAISVGSVLGLAAGSVYLMWKGGVRS